MIFDVLVLQFLSGTAGHYTATISGYTVSNEGGNSYSKLFMHLNGQQIDETMFLSGYVDGGQYYYDQGSRTMVNHTYNTHHN